MEITYAAESYYQLTLRPGRTPGSSTERPEGSLKLSLFFAQTFFALTFGTVHIISLKTKIRETMRVFEELCRNASHVFQIARR
jgi:hypothetical protein